MGQSRHLVIDLDVVGIVIRLEVILHSRLSWDLPQFAVASGLCGGCIRPGLFSSSPVDSDSSDTVVELKGSGAAVAPTTPSSRAGSNSVVTSRSVVLGGGKATPHKSVLSSCRWYSWQSLASLCQ